MPQPLKILSLSAEVAPFAKTGGLGCGLILFIVAACVIIGQVCQIDWLRLFVVGPLLGLSG